MRCDVEVVAIDAGTVRISDGQAVPADVVLAAVGVVPASDLAQDAGLDLHDGRVVVDEHMRTSTPGILAAGDLVFARNAAAGRHLAVEHWGDALAMGAVAGASAAGGEATWDQPPGFWSTIGDHTLKYAAWGDGYDDSRTVDHADGGFTVWYLRDGVTVGVLTHRADEDYEAGTARVTERRPRSSDS